MIKIFCGDRGGDTFKPPLPLRTIFAFTHPCFKMFLERSLNDPPPPHFKHLSLPPPPHPPPLPSPPTENFNHTPSYGSDRDSTERHVKPKNFFTIGFLVAGIVFEDTSLRLGYAPRIYILSPLWCSGTSFASHARGLGFEPGRVTSCILCFFHVVQIVG